MMGTSLLTMPWAFGQAGFAGGILTMIFMAGICLYTAFRILTMQNLMGKIQFKFTSIFLLVSD